jgi:outer membrane protein insertion porin family
LLGRGQDLRLNTSIAQYQQSVDLGFTEPYFLDRNLAAGFDLFEVNQNNQSIAQYNQLSFGGVLRAGYQINEALRQTLRYTLRSDTIDQIQSTASRFIQEEKGTRITSAVGQQLMYDKRDNRLEPTAGYFVSMSNDLAGLGGDAKYFRSVVQGGYFYSVMPRWVLSWTGEVGDITPLSGRILIEDRFFVGGDNLRGFAIGGIGPRDALTGDALGGNNYAVSSLSLEFPLGLPEELGVTGHVFTDFGTLFGVDESAIAARYVRIGPFGSKLIAGDTINDPIAIRISPGFGFSWKSPLGPIKIDLAYAVKKEPFDKRQLLNVSFGTRF